jgi:protein required for attachment to host cells
MKIKAFEANQQYGERIATQGAALTMENTIMKPEWILIANSTHARLLEHQHGSPMVVLQSFENLLGRSKVKDLADDKLGRENSDRGFGGTTYQPRVDAKQKEHTRFARELADYLRQGALQGNFRSLLIFASSPFLGELKPELDANTARLVSATHDLDLTSFGLSELEQRIQRETAR